MLGAPIDINQLPRVVSVGVRNARWKGPRYVRPAHWRKELFQVIALLAALTRVNRPLESGLLSAIAEERYVRGLKLPRKARGPAGPPTAPRAWVGWAAMAVILLAVMVIVATLLTDPYLRQAVDVGDLWVVLAIFCVMVVGILFLRLRLIPFSALVNRDLFGSARRRQKLQVMAALHRDLSQGLMLSESMRRLPKFFPAHFADLTAAGERTGSLAVALRELQQETAEAMHAERGNAAPITYLVTVITICAGITTFLVVKVLPVFAEIRAEFSGAETAPRLWLQDVIGDKYLVDNGPLNPLPWQGFFFVGLTVVAAWRIWYARNPPYWGYYLPYIGRTASLRSLHKVSLLMGRELEAGIPLAQAIDHVAQARVAPAHRRLFRRVSQRVAQGERMSDALRMHGRGLPASFVQMVDLGELSGHLPQALRQLAEIYLPTLRARQKITRTVLMCLAILLLGVGVLLLMQELFGSLVLVMEGILREV